MCETAINGNAISGFSVKIIRQPINFWEEAAFSNKTGDKHTLMLWNVQYKNPIYGTVDWNYFKITFKRRLSVHNTASSFKVSNQALNMWTFAAKIGFFNGCVCGFWCFLQSASSGHLWNCSF